jgi:hypothetical protein
VPKYARTSTIVSRATLLIVSRLIHASFQEDRG